MSKSTPETKKKKAVDLERDRTAKRKILTFDEIETSNSKLIEGQRAPKPKTKTAPAPVKAKPKAKPEEPAPAPKAKSAKKKKKAESEIESKTRDLVLSGKSALDQDMISKLDFEGMRSILGDEAENLQRMLVSGNVDGALPLITTRLIQSLIDLISQSENGIRESKGRYGVHGLVSMISTLRELMIDVQASKDRGALGQQAVETVLRPFAQDVAMTIMHEYAALVEDMKGLLSDKQNDRLRDAQIASRTRAASKIMEDYGKAADRLVEFLER